MTAPTVVVVDDHPVFRAGLVALLAEEAMTVVSSVGTSAAAVEAVSRLRPDIVVLDLHLPDGTGIDAAREMLGAVPEVRILVLTMDGSDAAVLAALRAGAQGYLLKEAAAEGVGAALRTLLNGDLVIDARLAARLPALLTAPPPSSDALAALSPREREIAALVATGCSNAEIGRRLFLAEKTVRNNLTAILAKLGVSSRGQLRTLVTAS